MHPTITNIPVSDIENSIKQKINTVWQNYWDSIPLYDILIHSKELKKA